MNNNISMESRLITNPDLVLRVEDDECGLLFNPDSGEVMVLNRSAVEIWNRLDGQCSLRELITSLREVFDDLGAEAESQILQTIDSLIQRGAVALAEQGK